MQSVEAASPSASEVRTWLIENDEARIAEHRARKAKTLAIAAGESGAAVSDLRVITCRQSQDHVMHPGHPRREDRLVILGPAWKRLILAATVSANSSMSWGR